MNFRYVRAPGDTQCAEDAKVAPHEHENDHFYTAMGPKSTALAKLSAETDKLADTETDQTDAPGGWIADKKDSTASPKQLNLANNDPQGRSASAPPSYQAAGANAGSKPGGDKQRLSPAGIPVRPQLVPSGG